MIQCIIMYCGYWEINKSYKTGEIVYITSSSEYYICIRDHVSDKLTFPNKEDIYWAYIPNDFLQFFKSVESNLDTVVDTLIENVIENSVKDKEDPQDDIGRRSLDRQDDISNLQNDTERRSLDRQGDLGGNVFKIISRNKRSYSDDHKKYQENLKQNELKRKIRIIEDDIVNYKRQKMTDDDTCMNNLRNQLLVMNLDIQTKTTLIDKYESTKQMTSSEYSKAINWLKTVAKIPYGKYKGIKVKSSDSSNKLKLFFEDVKQKLDKNIHGLEEVKQEILEFVARKITNPDSKGHVLALYGKAGIGKCFSKNTPILMFNGTIKMVQDIVPGDLLMGDDSTPRNVLTLGDGRDTMYKITNVKGENYTVNSEHILCLKYSTNKHIVNDKKCKRFRVKWFNNTEIKVDTKDFYYNNKDKNVILEHAKNFLNNIKEEKICEISVKKYLKLSQTIKKQLKGYSVPVDFDEKELDFDPYIIGLWLGDGSCRGTEICCQDSTILKYLSSKLSQYDCYLQYSGSQYDYRINGLKSNGKLGGNNRMLNTLKKYDLIKNKHIPYIYKCNSRENRLKLLAGLIDSDGSLLGNKSGYEFSQSLEHEQIIDDIIYLARSLGFACYKNRKYTSWTYKGIKKYGEAWRICISGKGIEEIPVLCHRKLANKRQQIKDVLVSGIIIEQLPEDNYYGFMIDGNQRFVLGNFIVTHNTCIIKSLAEALDLPFYQINFGGLNDVSVLTGHSETYIGSKPGKIVEILTSSNYMNPIIYLDEIDKISESKSAEISGILTHLLDEEQNYNFQDNYLSNISIDLSKVFFVIAFNDISKIDSIVSDRLKIIYIDPPSIEDKIIICQDKMIPAIMKTVQLKNNFNIVLEKELIEYIITCKTQQESGVRQLRKNIEKILNRLNYDILIDNLNLIKKEKTESQEYETLIITKTYVDNVIKNSKNEDKSYLEMYI